MKFKIMSAPKFNKNIKLYFSAVVFFYIAFGAFNMLQGLYIKELNFGEDYLGLLISFKTAAMGLAAFPCAFLVNSLGKKKSVFLSLLFISLSVVFQGYFRDRWFIMFFAVLQGIFNALLGVTEAPFLMENSKNSDAVKLFSYSFAINMFATMVGFKLSGKAAEILNNSFDLVQAYRVCIIGAGLIGLVSLIFVLGIKDVKNDRVQEHNVNIKETIRIFNNKGVKQFMTYNFLIGFGAGLVVPYFNVYLKYKININSDQLGTIMSISQIAMGTGGLIMPYLAKRFGKANAIIICQIASIPFLMLIATPPSIFIVSIAFFMRSALMNMAGPIIGNISMELVESEKRPILSSLNNVSNNISRALSAAVAGFIMKNIVHGYEIPYYITTALYITASVYFYKNFKSFNNAGRMSSKVIEAAE